MRHSTLTRRLLALATLTALVGGTLGSSVAALAREPAASAFGEKVGESGEGLITRSGTRGMVDPMKLPHRAADAVERPDKPPLSWSTSTPGGPSVRQPAGILVPPDPVQFTPTTRPPAGQPGIDGFYYGLGGGPDTTWQPPDPWVAVGPDHVIQTVNKSIQILDRSGNLIQSASLEDFFNLSAVDGNGNARVIFDSLHQRWVMTEVSWTCDATGGVGYIDFLVSSTADPTDPWRLDFLQANNFLPDFAAPGTSTVNLAIAANFFRMGPNCFGAGFAYFGTDIVFADWADIIRPPSAPDTVFDEFFFSGSGEPTTFFGARTAVQTPATSATVHAVVQYDDPADGIGTGPVVPAYFAFAGSAGAGTVNPTAISELNASGVVGPFVDPIAPAQPTQPPPVTTVLDHRPTDAIWQSNKFTWVSTSGCVPTGDLSLQDCVRVTQLDTGPAVGFTPPALIQDFLIGAANQDHYSGGVGMALDGTLHAVWTRSSLASYPSSYTGYQLRSDPDNSLTSPDLLKAGIAPKVLGNRWGGYVGVAQDPQVPNAVWQGNMYSGGGNIWKTFISQLQTGGSSYVPIPPVRVLDTRPAYQIGLSGVFHANTPRTFQVDNAFGIPAAAIAVTGNVTIVNQTGAGYLSVTPTSVVNPTSSTINFPLGDTRANNLTVPLATNGKLAAVYKAQAGKTTHLIVDVTGYFLPGDEDATYAPITPVRALDTRPGFAIGLAGPFAANTPRQLNITGLAAVPADATAITGNLTVVGQTRAGYLSITKTSMANPTTSTLNFPLGDIRANGISVPLNLGGGLWIVYKASGGSTHVILDVTGYYRDTPAGLLFYPLTPGRVMDTRAGVVLSGLSGPFNANGPRRLTIAGHWGAPAGAEAVTGNLTVVGQTAAGYVSATLGAEVNPTTSVINFPLADIRANGVTLPLNANGRSWFVYKAGAGKATHLVLDLSGYFD